VAAWVDHFVLTLGIVVGQPFCLSWFSFFVTLCYLPNFSLWVLIRLALFTLLKTLFRLHIIETEVT